MLLTDFYAIRTPIVWHILGVFFAAMGGGGGQNYFQKTFRITGVQGPVRMVPFVHLAFLPLALFEANVQQRKGHINSRKVPGTPAGCPRHSQRDRYGVYWLVSQGFPVDDCTKLTEKGIFVGTLAGCSRDTPPAKGLFRNFM